MNRLIGYRSDERTSPIPKPFQYCLFCNRLTKKKWKKIYNMVYKSDGNCKFNKSLVMIVYKFISI